MSVDNNYGYIGADDSNIVTDTNQTGIFSPKDIYNVTTDDKWGSKDDLRLIEEINISTATTTVDFLNVQGEFYGMHLVVFNNLSAPAQSQNFGFRFSVNGGSSFATSYPSADTYVNTSGGSADTKSNTRDIISLGSTGSDSRILNGFAYVMQMANTGYLRATSVIGKTVTEGGGTDLETTVAGVYRNTTDVNAIRSMTSGTSGFTTGKISLYGMKGSV